MGAATQPAYLLHQGKLKVAHVHRFRVITDRRFLTPSFVGRAIDVSPTLTVIISQPPVLKSRSFSSTGYFGCNCIYSCVLS
jgi:hypothetical protein